MNDSPDRFEQASALRRQAEDIYRNQAARLPEKSDDLSSEEMSRMFHELRVHQIELEMQNEELLRAQVELETVKSRYFDLYDLAPVSYFTISEEGMIVEANLAAAALLGLPRGELTDQPFTRFILKDDQDIHYLRRKQLFETGEPLDYDLLMVNSVGTTFRGHVTATVARNDRGVAMARLVVSDITARCELEQQLRLSEKKYRSLNTHLEQKVGERTVELTMINTSLTREIGDRVRIEQELLEQQQRLREMAQELALTEDRERDRIAAELHDEVNQRLVLAKMKVEALERRMMAPALQKSAEVICDLLAQTINDIRSLTAQIRPPLLANAGLEAAVRWLGDELHDQYGLRMELCDDNEPKVLEYGLSSCVFQAVRELLLNVVKHSGVSRARVEMRREGSCLVITVEDEGSGFDPVAANIRKARTGGFGLFNVHHKIEYLGGLFQVDSQPGAGTRATIRMPLTPSEAAGDTAGKLTILLVDDQSFVREGLRALMAGEPDLEVVAEAGSGRAAVAQARDRRPDVVVMDLSMNDMNGIDAARAITTELDGVRVVAFSVESDRRFVVEALKAGASGYVLKNSPFAVLAAAIRRVASGETYLGPRISEIIIREYLQRVPASESLGDEILTARERQVLQLIAAGKGTKEIALALDISMKTIDTLRHNIMNKLDLYSTAQLTKYAIREGLTSIT